MDLFILDREETLLGVLSGDAEKDALHFFNAHVIKEVNKGCNISFEVDMNGEGIAELIQEEHLVVFKDGNDFRLTIIKDIVSIHGADAVKEVYCEDASIELFDELITVGLVPNNTYNLETALSVVLGDTRWSVGDTSTVYSLRLPNDLVNESVLYGVSEIVNAFSSEVDFTVTFNGNKIVRRLVHARRQLGRDTGKRFEYRKDLEEIKRTVSTVNLKTAILPLGKEDEETGDRVTIADVEWTVAQNGIAKPKGQLYLEDANATAIWGYKSDTDRKRPRWMYIEYSDCESPAELINYANMQLASHREPKVTYEINAVDLYKLLDDEAYMFEAVGIGDTVAVIDHDFSPPLLLRSRVVKIEEDYSNNNTNRKITLGNTVSSIVDKSVKEQMADTVGGIKDNISSIRDTVNTVQRTADGKNRIFRGIQEPVNASEGDLWYKPVVIDNQDTFLLLIYTDGKWDELLSDLTGVRISARVDQVMEEAEQLKEQTEAMQKQAEETRNQAQGAFDNAQSALNTSQSAQEIATNARSEAEQARQGAKTALEKSENALVRVEDAEGNIAQITADVSAVGATVGNLEGNIANLQITSDGLQTSVSSVDGRVTALGVTVDGINTTVSNLDDRVTTINTTVNGISTSVSNAQGDISALQQTSNSLATRIENAEGNISTVTQLATGLQTTVTGPNGLQSQVTQLNNQYNVLINDTINDIQSSITAVPGQISMAVTNSETGMKNYISTTLDGLVLSGSQIVLDGNTVVTGEFTVGSANIRNLDASVITGGDLNFRNIRAINFDASNITTGTLQGVTINTTEVANRGNRIELRQGGMRIFDSNQEAILVDRRGINIHDHRGNGVRAGVFSRFVRSGTNDVIGTLVGTQRGYATHIGAQMANNTADNTFNTRIRVDGTTGDVDLTGARLQSNIASLGRGFDGISRFSGTGDVTIHRDKTLRLGWLGTEGYTTNARAHLVSRSVSDIRGLLIGDRRSEARGGFWIGENGAIGLAHRNAPTRLLDVENRAAGTGRMRIGQLMIVWGSGTATGVTGGGTRQINWTFGAPFANRPVVFINPNTSVPERVSVAASDISSTGFTAYIYRNNATNTGYSWVAIGPITS